MVSYFLLLDFWVDRNSPGDYSVGIYSRVLSASDFSETPCGYKISFEVYFSQEKYIERLDVSHSFLTSLYRYWLFNESYFFSCKFHNVDFKRFQSPFLLLSSLSPVRKIILPNGFRNSQGPGKIHFTPQVMGRRMSTLSKLVEVDGLRSRQSG